jgi:hypothetical protein
MDCELFFLTQENKYKSGVNTKIQLNNNQLKRHLLKLTLKSSNQYYSLNYLFSINFRNMESISYHL